MIQVTMLTNQNGKYIGFECIGHAGFADAGKDIVCAGVSALVINAVNSIDRYTSETFTLDTEEETGKLAVYFDRPAGHDAELLLNSLVLGIKGIQKQYEDKYITFHIKEV